MNKYAFILLAIFLTVSSMIILKDYSQTGQTNIPALYVSIILSMMLIVTYSELYKLYSPLEIFATIKIFSVVFSAISITILETKMPKKNTIIGIIF